MKYPLPEPIPDTPENIAKAILATPPRKRNEWQHVREREAPAYHDIRQRTDRAQSGGSSRPDSLRYRS